MRQICLVFFLVFSASPARLASAQPTTTHHSAAPSTTNEYDKHCPLPEDQTKDPTKIPACSYSAINGNCSVTIDRMNPVTPPTIYVKPYCRVKVLVVNSSPLEDLSLDSKAGTAAPPNNSLQTAATGVIGGLGKFVFTEDAVMIAPLTITQPGAPPPPLPLPPPLPNCEDTPAGCTDTASIVKAMQRISDDISANDPQAKAKDTMEDIQAALQSPPGGLKCDPHPNDPTVLPNCSPRFGDTPKTYIKPWHNTAKWREHIAKTLTDDLPPDGKVNKIKLEYQRLVANVKALGTAAKSVDDQARAAVLSDNLTVLGTQVSQFSDASLKVQALANGITNLALTDTTIEGNDLLYDPFPSNPNYQTQTASLDYVNNLQPVVQRATADTLKTAAAAEYSSTGTAPNKVLILTITAQFQRVPRLEVSTGLMVPLFPYHSYSKAEKASGGVVTDNVVQETDSNAVVPMAFINVPIWQWMNKNQPWSFAATGGVGANSATSNIEFGAGVTLSYRWFAVSGLADIGQDTSLSGGFTPNESLGTSNPSDPLTSTNWGVKPAVAISIRLPLGGVMPSK